MYRIQCKLKLFHCVLHLLHPFLYFGFSMQCIDFFRSQEVIPSCQTGKIEKNFQKQWIKIPIRIVNIPLLHRLHFFNLLQI